jgi:hypothetical protein
VSDPASNVRTIYLGQFTQEHAEAIAAELEAGGIVWWAKAPGLFTQIWERGVRLFVDRARLAEAEAIAVRVLADDQAGGSPSGQS